MKFLEIQDCDNLIKVLAKGGPKIAAPVVDKEQLLNAINDCIAIYYMIEPDQAYLTKKQFNKSYKNITTKIDKLLKTFQQPEMPYILQRMMLGLLGEQSLIDFDKDKMEFVMKELHSYMDDTRSSLLRLQTVLELCNKADRDYAFLEKAPKSKKPETILIITLAKVFDNFFGSGGFSWDQHNETKGGWKINCVKLVFDMAGIIVEADEIYNALGNYSRPQNNKKRK